MIIINITIMWDMPINTDRIITANRPDINVKDSMNCTCKLIDITVTSDRNIALKEIEKKSKYKDLELEIQRMWHMKTVLIPVVVGVFGTVKKGMVENIKKAMRVSYCDRGPKDLHAGICANPQLKKRKVLSVE